MLNCKMAHCAERDACFNDCAQSGHSPELKCGNDPADWHAQGLWIVSPDGSQRELDTSAFAPADPVITDGEEFLSVFASMDGRSLAALIRPEHTLVSQMVHARQSGTSASGRLLTSDDSRVGAAFVGKSMFGKDGHGDPAAWDFRSGELLRNYGPVADATVDPDEAVVAVQATDGKITRFNAVSGALIGGPFNLPAAPEWDLFAAPLVWRSPAKGEWYVCSIAALTGREGRRGSRPQDHPAAQPQEIGRAGPFQDIIGDWRRGDQGR